MKNISNKGNVRGFTLVEVIVIIVIIGILSTIGVYSYNRVQTSTRDSQRSSQIAIIAEALEKYYSQNGEYPSCADITQDPNTVATNTLVGINEDVLTTPSNTENTNSFICSDPTADNFSYIGGGDKYTLEYLSEATKNIVSVNSIHSPLIIDAPLAPSLSVEGDSMFVKARVSTVICTLGTAQYGIRLRINDGVWSDYSIWDISTEIKEKASGLGYRFDFQAQARCYVDSNTYSNAVISEEETYIAPIYPPAAPIVASSTPGATTTWSWPAVECWSTTARYQYNYYTSYGYDSGWVATAGLSVGFTTSNEGYTYYLKVQAQCYNVNTTSDWSTSSDAVSYYRPMTVPILTATTASSTSINLSWGAITGATSYTLQRDTSSAFSTATTIATQAGTTFTSSGLSSGNTYYYRLNETSPGGTSGWSATAGATTTINTPSAPVIAAASTVGSTTTWSWAAVSCAAGTNVRYQYDYYTSYGYDSGWVLTNGTSVAFTTSSENYTYYVKVQAQCTTSMAMSGWSSTSNIVSYYRPITVYTLTTIAGAGGSVSAGGSYNNGTVRTITATPSGYYAFSSWSGSAGCSGAASHTITIDSNKSCTANFYLPSYTLTVAMQGTDADHWLWCGNENAACTYGGAYGGTGRVRYGVEPLWAVKNFGAPSGVVGTPCTNANFGDPAPGQVKMCFFEQYTTVSGGGTFSAGSSAPISVNPTAYFVEWNCKYDGTMNWAPYKTTPNATVLMDGSMTCTALFNA